MMVQYGDKMIPGSQNTVTGLTRGSARPIEGRVAQATRVWQKNAQRQSSEEALLQVPREVLNELSHGLFVAHEQASLVQAFDEAVKRHPVGSEAHAMAVSQAQAYASGSLSFGQVLRCLPYDPAQKILKQRAEAMNAFFQSWAESLARNAKLDKAAAQRHTRAQGEIQRTEAGRVEKKRSEKNARRVRAQLKLLRAAQSVVDAALREPTALAPSSTASGFADALPRAPVPAQSTTQRALTPPKIVGVELRPARRAPSHSQR